MEMLFGSKLRRWGGWGTNKEGMIKRENTSSKNDDGDVQALGKKRK